MIEDRTLMLVDTMGKLLRRGAIHNIRRVMQKTHEADIAAALDHFQNTERLQIFKLEPSDKNRAVVFSYLKHETQKEILAHLNTDEKLKLITLMASDDAADLLGELSEEESKEILSKMHKDDSVEVADLLGYDENSAGGIMSSDFIALDQNLDVAQAIHALQEDSDGSVAFYIYVIDENLNLVGVLSLKQLLLSKQTQKLKELMITDVISTPVNAPQEEVAKKVERYDFLSLPVVDDNNKLIGVITVDDILDVIRAEAEEDLLERGQASAGDDESFRGHFRARIPWVLLAFASGLLGSALFYYYVFSMDAQVPNLFLTLTAFFPVLLLVGLTLGSQAATVSDSALRTKKFGHGKFFNHFWLEMRLGFVFVAILGALLMLAAYGLFASPFYSELLKTFSSHVMASMALGTSVPVVLERLKFNATALSVPVFTSISNIVGVLLVLFFSR